MTQFSYFCLQEQEKVANLAASKFNSEQQNAEGEGDTYEPNPEVKEEEEKMEEGTDDKGMFVLSSFAFSCGKLNLFDSC